MTINELIEFLNENFDEKQRKTMDVSLVREYDYGCGSLEPIGRFNMKVGLRGAEIHVIGYE